MKSAMLTFVRKLWKDERGQTMPLVAAALTGLLGVSGLTIDVGNFYTVRAQLQSTTNAAALAAAGSVWNSTSSTSAATSTVTNFLSNYYSNNYGVSFSDGAAHNVGSLGTVTPPTVTAKCLKMLLASGQTCSSTTTNAVRVTQSATTKTHFMSLFGVKSVTISATATASMLGPAQPWNVAVILDSSGSMANADSNCGGITQFKCATNGIKVLLAAVNPCVSGATTCTNDNSLFRVALFIFPSVTTASASKLYASSSGCSAPSWTIYGLPSASATAYTDLQYTYTTSTTTGWGSNQKTTTTTNTLDTTYNALYGASDADTYGFVSNYYSSTSSTSLNSSSSLVKAVSGCITPVTSSGIGDSPTLVGGSASYTGITYHASAIYAAEAVLIAEQKLHSGSSNAIILLSDGQANLDTNGNLTPSSVYTAVTSGAQLYTGNTTGTYPSYKDQCQQAIIAGQTATDAGTRVYTVAYGAETYGCGKKGTTSGSALVDTTLVATGRNAAFTSTTQLTPCRAMENIASSLNYFYSDYQQTDAGNAVDTSCQDSAHTATSLNAIFQAIAGTFTYPRLLPNDAT
jgi:Flp pilus assembly protein TadG